MSSLRLRRTFILVGGLLVSSCARRPPQLVGSDLSYLPNDSVFVAAFDAARLRQEPLYKDLESEMTRVGGKWQEAKTFLLRLGIDPDKDLESVLVAYRGVAEKPGEWVAILRGRFDVARIEKGLEEPDARMSTETYGRRTIYNLVRLPDIGELSLTILDPTAVAVGGGDALRSVIDIRDKSAPSLAHNGQMKRLVGRLDPKAQVWAVLDGREVSRRMRGRLEGNPDSRATPGAKSLSAMQTGRFSLAFSKDFALALDLESDTEKSARNLADALKGIVAFGKMGAGAKDEDAVALIEAIRVESDRSEVRVRLRLAGDTLKRLQAKFGEAAAQTPLPVPPGVR